MGYITKIATVIIDKLDKGFLMTCHGTGYRSRDSEAESERIAVADLEGLVAVLRERFK